MASPLLATVEEIHDTHVIVSVFDTQHWSIPLTNIVGKPVLHQPLFIAAAAPGSETQLQHPLASAVVEHLLNTPTP